MRENCGGLRPPHSIFTNFAMSASLQHDCFTPDSRRNFVMSCRLGRATSGSSYIFVNRLMSVSQKVILCDVSEMALLSHIPIVTIAAIVSGCETTEL